MSNALPNIDHAEDAPSTDADSGSRLRAAAPCPPGDPPRWSPDFTPESVDLCAVESLRELADALEALAWLQSRLLRARETIPCDAWIAAQFSRGALALENIREQLHFLREIAEVEPPTWMPPELRCAAPTSTEALPVAAARVAELRAELDAADALAERFEQERSRAPSAALARALLPIETLRRSLEAMRAILDGMAPAIALEGAGGEGGSR
jgi:hypothetical protein